MSHNLDVLGFSNVTGTLRRRQVNKRLAENLARMFPCSTFKASHALRPGRPQIKELLRMGSGPPGMSRARDQVEQGVAMCTAVTAPFKTHPLSNRWLERRSKFQEGALIDIPLHDTIASLFHGCAHPPRASENFDDAPAFTFRSPSWSAQC